MCFTYTFIAQSWSQLILKSDKEVIISGHSLRQSIIGKDHRMRSAETSAFSETPFPGLSTMATPKHLIWFLRDQDSTWVYNQFAPLVDWEWKEEVAILPENQSLWEVKCLLYSQIGRFWLILNPFLRTRELYPPQFSDQCGWIRKQLEPREPVLGCSGLALPYAGTTTRMRHWMTAEQKHES